MRSRRNWARFWRNTSVLKIHKKREFAIKFSLILLNFLFQCHFCTDRFIAQEWLKTHITSDLENPGFSWLQFCFKCDVCMFELRNNNCLENHTGSYHMKQNNQNLLFFFYVTLWRLQSWGLEFEKHRQHQHVQVRKNNTQHRTKTQTIELRT